MGAVVSFLGIFEIGRGEDPVGVFQKLVLHFGLPLQLSCRSYGRSIVYRALGPNHRSRGQESSLIPGEGS